MIGFWRRSMAPRRVVHLAREVGSTVHAAVILALVELLVRGMQLPKVARLLGVDLDLQPPDELRPRVDLAELSRTDRRRLRCALRVTEAWPFSRGPCLRSALVSGYLLRHLDPRVRIGLTRDDLQVTGHAWLEIGGRPLEDTAGHLPFELREQAEIA